MLRHLSLALLLSLGLGASATAAPLTPAEEAAIDKAVTGVLSATGVPSAQIAVVRDGRLVYSHAFGKAADNLPAASTAMPYQIASNSKQFLGALILMLRDEGKLSLDDKVAKFVPGVAGGDRITVRQLLSHTAGLQDYWPQDYSFSAMASPVQPREIVARWGSQKLDFEPGTRWQYSNTGFVVAGLVAEKAGGAPLWRQFERRIFKPLHIKVTPVDEANGPGFPQGYKRNALGPVRPAQPPAKGWLWAAGELSMSAESLAKWDIARIDRKLMPARDWREQETPVILSDGTDSQYGLGVSFAMVGGRRAIKHGGESVGFLSQNTVFPDQRAAVVVLTNADFSDAHEEITTKVADIVLPKIAANNNETARLDDARAEFAAIAGGRFARDHFTTNGLGYFSPQTLADYTDSLGKLGEIKRFEALGKPRLRGGFVNRNFSITVGDQKLLLVTYAEPGEHGRWEQFMVMPGS
jgi:D-alanyl-D-alanine carboxypeptidase